ncbi:hypothetical protein [Leisingera sp. MMG026]|uniref:hypothetical protein n=1 Tax=Leisingera sp. MMG026 TaxID=2909982 RepID=UPI001F48C2AC|nr:hypothetical protein [Leisingera sp. MMG026]MCF6432909.1 hypothetical protein [Leisingera sp. MMG026]
MAKAEDKTPKKEDYVTTADGWTAGQWRPRGAPVSLTKEQAKYENVILASALAKPAAAKAGAAKK